MISSNAMTGNNFLLKILPAISARQPAMAQQLDET
jgi:hypothetical protein